MMQGICSILNTFLDLRLDYLLTKLSKCCVLPRPGASTSSCPPPMAPRSCSRGCSGPIQELLFESCSVNPPTVVPRNVATGVYRTIRSRPSFHQSKAPPILLSRRRCQCGTDDSKDSCDCRGWPLYDMNTQVVHGLNSPSTAVNTWLTAVTKTYLMLRLRLVFFQAPMRQEHGGPDWPPNLTVPYHPKPCVHVCAAT